MWDKRRSAADLSKVHVVVDTLGNPLRLRLTFDPVIADRGYAAQTVVDEITASGALAVIPPRPRAETQRDYDR